MSRTEIARYSVSVILPGNNNSLTIDQVVEYGELADDALLYDNKAAERALTALVRAKLPGAEVLIDEY